MDMFNSDTRFRVDCAEMDIRELYRLAEENRKELKNVKPEPTLTRDDLMKRWGIDSLNDFDTLVSYFPITPMKRGSFFIPRILFGKNWEEGEGWSVRDVEAYEGRNAFIGWKLWDMIAYAYATKESNNSGA